MRPHSASEMLTKIGEQYADIDTVPLRPPSDWIQPKDLSRWKDPHTNTSFGPVPNSSPVKLILGIEADTHEDSNSFWRMGYNYPVQLTQWALASTANHAVLGQFLRNFKAQIKGIATHTQEEHANVTSIISTLQRLDPIELTGPAAITAATKEYLEETEGLRWQAMSGLEDGGRSKVVADTLILPITGFRYGTDNIRAHCL
jgi:mannosyltransferase OCH1-like enzyme